MKPNNTDPHLTQTSRPFDVVGIGALNVDLIVESAEGNTEDSEGTLPRERLVALGRNGRPFLGGSAYNTLSLLGRINPLGEEPLRLGMIGVSGVTGYEIPAHVKALSDLNIESLVTSFDEDSGLCVSVASSTGRKLFVDPGVNLRIAELLSDTHHRERLLEQLMGCRVLHVTSLLDRKGESKVAHAVASFVTDLKERSRSTIISVDPGDPWVKTRSWKAVNNIFRIADIVFLNEQEFNALTGSVPSDSSAAEALSAFFPRAAVHIVKDYRSVNIILPSGIVAASIPQTTMIDAVDPTGAGDAFSAGVLCAIASNHSLYEGSSLGLTLAALRVSAVGDEAHRNVLKQLSDLWTVPEPPEAIPRRSVMESLAAHASPIRTVAESVIAIGIIVAGLLTLPAKIREWTDVTYDYVATPNVIAYQYAFPNDTDQSQADSMLAFGQHVRITCRRDDPNKEGMFWLKQSSGRWVMGNQFSPASDEIQPDELPECP